MDSIQSTGMFRPCFPCLCCYESPYHAALFSTSAIVIYHHRGRIDLFYVQSTVHYAYPSTPYCMLTCRAMTAAHYAFYHHNVMFRCTHSMLNFAWRGLTHTIIFELNDEREWKDESLNATFSSNDATTKLKSREPKAGHNPPYASQTYHSSLYLNIFIFSTCSEYTVLEHVLKFLTEAEFYHFLKSN